MIQRKQTLYLFGIAILSALLLFFPLCTLTGIAPAGATVLSKDIVTFDIWGIHYSTGGGVNLIYLGILTSLTVAVAAVSVFLYRKRWIQVRLCFVLAILLVGIIAFELMYFYKLRDVAGYLINFSVVMLAPLFALPMVYFAYKGIAKDIALLRSADRIR